MSTFTMLIGLPGCGKSTWAKNCQAVIVSSDTLRQELYGDENDQTDPDRIFNEARKRIIMALNAGKDAVLDATNINRKQRMRFIKDIKSQMRKTVDLKVAAVWVCVPYHECLSRNANRERNVPEYVIKKMYLNFCPPGYEEGFDEIKLHFAESYYEDYILYNYLEHADMYYQQNPHHTLTLGGHSRKCADYVAQHSDSCLLFDVALLHDCGKPFTASYYNSKGEKCDKLHFYQHHCVGAYDSVFYLKNLGYSDEEAINGARLIWWHMRPLREWRDNPKIKDKDLAMLDKSFIDDFNILHEGDLQAH